jgi:hypothetical protein
MDGVSVFVFSLKEGEEELVGTAVPEIWLPPSLLGFKLSILLEHAVSEALSRSTRSTHTIRNFILISPLKIRYAQGRQAQPDTKITAIV